MTTQSTALAEPSSATATRSVSLFGFVPADRMEFWAECFGPDGAQEVAFEFQWYKTEFFSDSGLRRVIPSKTWKAASAQEDNNFKVFRTIFETPMKPDFAEALTRFVSRQPTLQSSLRYTYDQAQGKEML